MSTFDFVIIGAGPAGEAAANEARSRGASVAIIDRRWFGGSCPFIGCLPSKSLLHGAAEHAARPDGYPWSRASDARDYMVNRAPDAAEPDDAGHVSRLEDVRRGLRSRRCPDRGPRDGRGAAMTARPTRSPARNVVVAVGIHVEGAAPPRPRRGADLDERARRPGPRAAAPSRRPRGRPHRLRAVPGLRPVRRPGHDRPVRRPADADRASAQLRGHGRAAPRATASRSGSEVRAIGARAGAGTDGVDVVDLDDGTTVEGDAILLAVGRSFPLDDLGLEHYGLDTSGRTPRFRATVGCAWPTACG